MRRVGDRRSVLAEWGHFALPRRILPRHEIGHAKSVGIDLFYLPGEAVFMNSSAKNALPDALGHFGPYGGRFVPETLVAPVEELTAAYLEARRDASFLETLRGLLKSYVGPAIAISSRGFEYRSRRFIFISIPSSGDTLAMPLTSHERAGLFTGRIYGRTEAARTEEVRDSIEVLRMLDRIIAERLRRLLGKRE